MKSEDYVKRRLDAVAEKYFQANSSGFKDMAHFRFCLEECYALVANETCWKLEELQDPKFDMDYDEFAASGADGRVDFDGFCNIPSDDFEQLFALDKYEDGKRKRVPHSGLLKLLAEDDIIAINPHYQKGRFAKSYLLHWNFISEVWKEHLGHNYGQKVKVDYFKLFGASYPKRLLARKTKEAVAIYNSLGEVGGLKVILPTDWEKNVTPYGAFTFDEKLTVENLIRGMKLFRKHGKGHYKHHRHFDWFVGCSSAFCVYIYKGEKHYRELVDCHSGIFWMFALHALKGGRISADECKRMIDHCFGGSFYTDVSGREKTRAVKTMFMKVLNMRARDVRRMEKVNHDELFIHIKGCLARVYPEWSAYLERLRNTPSERKKIGIGRYNHYSTTKIEHKIMDELTRKLESSGYSDLRRVHDALYGLDDISNIDEILYEIVLEFMNHIDQ